MSSRQQNCAVSLLLSDSVRRKQSFVSAVAEWHIEFLNIKEDGISGTEAF